MAKVIPEIYVSNVDQAELLETEEEAHLKSLTGNENMQAQTNDTYEAFSDLEISSTEEEVTPYQPLEIVSSDFYIGETSEKLMNVHSPGKIQKSYTYFLKASEMNEIEDSLTDYEGISVSEDDEELISVVPQFRLRATTDEKIKIKEHFITESCVSPCLTPDPKFNAKINVSHSPIQAHTDTELVYSDDDVPFRKKINNGKFLFDGFLSDAEDSDTSLSDNPFMHTRKASLQYSKSNQLKSRTNIRKTSDPNLTDIEYIDEFNSREKTKTGKQQKVKNCLTGKKHLLTVKKNSDVQKKIKGKFSNKKSLGFLELRLENGGNTDIEEFEKEDKGSDTDDQIPVYVPESKSQIVISNQNSKGDIALIIPITKFSGSKLSIMELNEIGHSDVEELQDFCAEESAIFYPSPEPPTLESSSVQASEMLKENSKLKLAIEAYEPLTDTEEININNTFRSKKVFKKKQNRLSTIHSEEIYENLTDVEDLGMEKNDECIESQDLVTSQRNTDTEDFSDDGANEEQIYPDFNIISSCNIITAKENIGPLSSEIKSKVSKASNIPLINTISPSPIPYNTEMEDMSGEEDISSSLVQADDCNIEPHSSTVHIRHSRKFQPRTDELKEFLQQPEPLTDIEEVEYKETENNKWNQRKEHKETAIAKTTKSAVSEDTKTKHDEDHSDGSDGYSLEPKGPSQHEVKKK